MNLIKSYRDNFEEILKKPDLRSTKYCYGLDDWESFSAILAGPLYEIYEQGHCDYVYQDKENRFNGVKDADGLLDWFVDLINRYQNHVLQDNYSDESEKQDQKILKSHFQKMKDFVQLAYEIIKLREKK